MQVIYHLLHRFTLCSKWIPLLQSSQTKLKSWRKKYFEFHFQPEKQLLTWPHSCWECNALLVFLISQIRSHTKKQMVNYNSSIKWIISLDIFYQNKQSILIENYEFQMVNFHAYKGQYTSPPLN